MDNDKGSVDQMKWDFLHEEILTMSLSAAFMFGRIYGPDVGERDRLTVREGVKAKLREYRPSYSDAVDEPEHVNNITELSDRLSSEFRPCLRNGRFRVGISQKALNLYLKYLWCRGEIDPPPHCPFDSRIIGLLPPKVRQAYTKVDKVGVYEDWVSEAKKIARGKPLAEWELSEFERLRF